MEQSANHAAVSDAQINLRKVDCAGDMEQRPNVAATNFSIDRVKCSSAIIYGIYLMYGSARSGW